MLDFEFYSKILNSLVAGYVDLLITVALNYRNLDIENEYFSFQ